MLPIALVLALVWGGLWAAFLQFTGFGQFLAQKRTWVTVIVGVGVDLLILLLVVPWEWWWQIAAVLAASSLAIIGRSLYNEWGEIREYLNGLKNATAE